MNFLKKWIGCIVSFVAGVCGLALSACSGMIAKVKFPDALATYGLESSTETTKAFKVLTDSNLYTQAKEMGLGKEFMAMKVFAIITLIVSVLLIAYAIVMLLKNLNVIKLESKLFGIVGICLMAALLVSTIGLFVASNNYASETEKIMKSLLDAELGVLESMLGISISIKLAITTGFYQPAMLVIAIISAIAVGTFTFLKRKSA